MWAWLIKALNSIFSFSPLPRGWGLGEKVQPSHGLVASCGDQPPSWSCLGAHQELSHQRKLRDGQKELIMSNEDAPINQDFPRVLGAQGQELMTETNLHLFIAPEFLWDLFHTFIGIN